MLNKDLEKQSTITSIKKEQYGISNNKQAVLFPSSSVIIF
jgi:hypothetical protein